MSTPNADEIARKRLLAINLVRLCGVGLIMVGLLFALDRIDVQPAHLIGVVFILVGMVDTFVMPLVLARRWRSDGQ